MSVLIEANLRSAPRIMDGWRLKMDEFLEKFQTGGGGISNQKIFVANLRFAWIGWGTTFDLRKAEISETH